MNNFDHFLQIIGPFGFYALIIAIVILLITFFTKIARTMILAVLVISALYYYLGASPQQRVKMDNYIKNVVQVVIKGNIDPSSIKDKVTSAVNNISQQAQKSISNLEHFKK